MSLDVDGHRWSLDDVLRQVSTSTPFSFFSSLTSGEPSTWLNGENDARSSSKPVDEAVDLVERDFADDRSISPSNSSSTTPIIWKSFLNSLTGFEDQHTEFRMIRTHFDDPAIEAMFNGPSQRARDDPSKPSKKEDLQRIMCTAAAVENPDGSLAVASLCDSQSTKALAPKEENEDRTFNHIERDDRRQIDAIEAADARLRQLYNRSS